MLEIGQILRADIRLSLGNVSESVHVTAEVAVLNTENGAIKGDVIVQQEINDLPLDGRDFTDLAFLVPGVMPRRAGRPGIVRIHQRRPAGLHQFLRGWLQQPQCHAAPPPRCGPNMDAMQEFKMEVSGYSAEIGRMAGGVLNMVMRSGTNQYHGDVFEYIRNNVIDARGFFDRDKNPLHRNQYGAMLSRSRPPPETLQRPQPDFLHVQLGELQADCVARPRITHVPIAARAAGRLLEIVQPDRRRR